MDDLILRSLQGKTVDLEESILRKWREEALTNEAEYQRMAQIWQLEARRPPPGSPPPRPALGGIVQAAEARRREAWTDKTEMKRRRPQNTPWRWPRLLVGLAAAAVLVLSIGLPQVPAPGPVSTPAFAAAEFTTGNDQVVTVSLNDGSYVRLAPSSRLLVNGVEGRREVFLEGRAYFAVASDPDRPFAVRTRLGDALVVGTRFEMDVRDENLRLLVSEGHVVLAAEGEQVDLRAGDVIHLAAGGMPILEQVEDAQELLDWPSGLLLFQTTPLRDVARELRAHFGVPFEIDGDEVGERTVSGWFDDESLEEVLSAICRATGTRCVTSGGVVRITSGKDP